MGSIGPAEILVVLVIALVVLGPTRLPDAARSLGKAISELRKVSSGLQSEVRDAFSDKPTYPSPRTDAAGSPAPGGGEDRPQA
ncbi:MAG: twin-arginine translocase TatA/TatE family subunit, partial [Acidimicrobiales bacterium]